MALLLACALQEDWTGFRGPGGAAPAGLPDRWNATENIAWKAKIPGRGWSSPIVWKDRVYLTTAVSEGAEEEPRKGLYFGGERGAPSKHRHVWAVIALDLKSGAVVWKTEVHAGLPETPLHIKNSRASETPCTDGERIYAYFGNVGLFALDLDGRPVWNRTWPAVRTRFGWGSAASPIVQGGKVYILNDNEDGSFLEALDAKTGATAWRADRDEKSNWSTPFVWENSARREIVTTGTQRVRSYSLDGKLLWEMKGMSMIAIPTPFAEGDLLYLASGYVMDKKRPLLAIGAGGAGDISLAEGDRSNATVRWSQPMAGPYNTTPLLYKGVVYVLYDQGFFAAYDAKSGEPVYGRQRIRDGATAFTSSPWASDDRIFCLSEEGDTFVLKAGKEFGLLHTNPLGEMGMATPAVAGRSLILRTDSHLWKIAAAP